MKHKTNQVSYTQHEQLQQAIADRMAYRRSLVTKLEAYGRKLALVDEQLEKLREKAATYNPSEPSGKRYAQQFKDKSGYK